MFEDRLTRAGANWAQPEARYSLKYLAGLTLSPLVALTLRFAPTAPDPQIHHALAIAAFITITAARSWPTKSSSGAWPPNFAFVGEPQNQRRDQPFKEQVVDGRIYRTIDDVRAAVREFFERYNAECLIQKNGLRSPRQTLIAWEQAFMKQAA